jgi:hypothetical protein
MTVEALMDLRKGVDEMLLKHRAELEKQLEKMNEAGEAHREEEKSRRNIVSCQAKCGQVVAQDLVGLLRR